MIITAVIAFGYNCHQLRPHSSSNTFIFNVLISGNFTTDQAPEICTATLFGWVRRFAFATFDSKGDGAGFLVNRGFYPGLFALFLAQPKGADQRHLCAAAGVGALYCARPQPGNHRFAVAPRIQMPNFFLGAVAHPFAVVAHVGGQSGGPFPGAGAAHFGTVAGVHRRPVGKLGRDFNQGFVNHHRHRVQVAGVGFQAQPLRF